MDGLTVLRKASRGSSQLAHPISVSLLWLGYHLFSEVVPTNVTRRYKTSSKVRAGKLGMEHAVEVGDAVEGECSYKHM
jgi:hypothetical protein